MALPAHGDMTALRDAVASGAVSAEAVCAEAFRAVRAQDEAIHAFHETFEERAMERARALDHDRAAGRPLPPLAGMTVAVKDNLATSFGHTTCSSRMLGAYRSPFDATAVERLERAGAIVVGKTNMDEFAMGSSNENSYFGAALNPWDKAAIPGGSSGGSAVAVAADLAPVATGTDTGGSVRQPAAMCGITGIKPTYGRVSRYGMIAFASSLDQGGAMGRSAEDCALLLSAMAGFDPRDSTSLQREPEDFAAGLQRSLAGLRIGVPKEFFGEGLAPDVRAAVGEALARFEREGAHLVEISLPRTSLSIPAYYVIAPAEASSNLSRFDGVRYGYRAPEYRDLVDMYEKTRSQGFGAEVKRRIMVGAYVLSHGYYDAYYLKAQKLRRLIADDFRAAFEQVDLIAGPVSPTVAWNIGEMTDDPVRNYLADIYTLPASLAGLPGMSVPVGFGDGGRPVGLQLIGDYFTESRLLGVAHMFQQVTDWHQRRPEQA